MLNENLKTYSEHSRQSGFAVLAVLVAVAIMMLLYFIDIRAIFGPGMKMAESGQPEHRPWLEEDRILGPDKLIKLPKPPQPKLDELFTITAPVSRDEQDRGEVIIDFTAAGEVSGSWRCQYSHEKRDYQFDTVFAGNIDVTKIYTEKKGSGALAELISDPSKLFFIAKGQYSKTTYNIDIGDQSVEDGIAYLTGYLEPEYLAFGQITITTDQTWSATYIWQGQMEKD